MEEIKDIWLRLAECEGGPAKVVKGMITDKTPEGLLVVMITELGHLDYTFIKKSEYSETPEPVIAEAIRDAMGASVTLEMVKKTVNKMTFL